MASENNQFELMNDSGNPDHSNKTMEDKWEEIARDCRFSLKTPSGGGLSLAPLASRLLEIKDCDPGFSPKPLPAGLLPLEIKDCDPESRTAV